MAASRQIGRHYRYGGTRLGGHALPSLQQLQFWRGLGRPGISLVIGCDNLIGEFAQELTKCGDIQSVMSRSEPREVPLRQPEQANRRRQAPAMFRMQWVFEVFLKMNESPGRLNQSFEIVCIG